MAAYTQLNRQDILSICSLYNLRPVSFHPIAGGAANSSFLIKSVLANYVLTVFDEKTWDSVIGLARLLRFLAENNYSTHIIQPLANGKWLLKYLGKPVIIKKYIPGRVIIDFDAQMLHQIGRSLAQLHQLPVPEFLPTEHGYGRSKFPTIFNNQIDPTYESWLVTQCEQLRNFPQNLPTGLIHGDLFFDNILFHNGQIAAIIDFEEACCYYTLFDVGMAIVGCCTSGTHLHLKKARSFISGYQQLHKLKDIEKGALHQFIAYAATATSFWRFRKYHIDTPMPENAHKHEQMMAIADSINALSEVEFLTAVF